jgi:hypothetical protein
MQPIEERYMWRFLVPACLGILVLTTPGSTQFYPEARQAYGAQSYGYHDQPEDLVRAWYQKYLNREVDAVGYQAWVSGLRSGTSPEMTLAGILSSDEYYLKGGNTPEGYIQTLFQDLTGRPPTPGEQDYWLRRLYHEQRVDIAYAMVTRYPQTWGAAPRPGERHEIYEYRRPIWRYRR